MKHYALFFILLISSCSSTQWISNTTPSEKSVATVFSNNYDVDPSWDIDISYVKAFDLKNNLRPCCAFGTKHKVHVSSVPIPFVRLSNTVSNYEIGTHIYNSGQFTNSSDNLKNKVNNEVNGLIYTKRGGFLDTAHIRDTADNT